MYPQNRLVGNANDLVEEGILKILSSIKAMKTLAKMVWINLFRTLEINQSLVAIQGVFI